MKKCIYCKTEIEGNCVVDFCEKCGVNAFGRKMFDTIIKNMENARENQDLCNTRLDQFGQSFSSSGSNKR